jgi:hypothetical protein
VIAGLKRLLLQIEAAGYATTVWLLSPINWLLSKLLAGRVVPGSVLHVSVMVHVPAYMVRILRENGINADYLAVGHSPWWRESDYHFRPTRVPLLSVLKEMWWVWRVVARYEIVHSHFMITVSRAGWEWALLRQMGRKLVIHYRGCEIRDRERNMAMHPRVNICQECDYRPYVCKTPFNTARRPLAAQHGSAFLVTTPDMKDFVPTAQHIPFFMTRPDPPKAASRAGRRFKIVHATNHPGIEGSRQIRDAIAALIAKGHAIDFVELNGVTHDRVLAELADADLSIGKMKMGYYANLQVESLAAGVPAVTCIRDEFVTDAIVKSGLILASLDTLETVIEHYLTHPEELARKKAIARERVLALHDNAAIAQQYKALYARLREAEVA